MVVISSDSHAGAPLLDYKPYLEQRWHDEFDAWAAAYTNPWEFMDPRDEEVELRTGPSSWHTSLNWDSDQRLRDTESDGVVAEVLFPNTAPPFIPTTTLLAEAPRDRAEYDRRWAGLQAHNRWLVDFCAEAPGRRAGVAQVMLYDVDDALAEVRTAVQSGLTGGILIPPDSATNPVPLYRKEYAPLWSVCEELEVPVHRHGTPPAAEPIPELIAIGLMETGFYNTRALPELILAGVFERHPSLRFIFSEVGCAWVPEMLGKMDFFHQTRNEATGLLAFMKPALAELTLTPSEYFARNCWIGSSLFLPVEAQMKHIIGVDRIMWGHDYPHAEGSFPYAREAYRATLSDATESEIRSILGLNAAAMYKFDVETLQPIADRVGPSLSEITQPLVDPPRVPEDTFCVTFGGLAAMAEG